MIDDTVFRFDVVLWLVVAVLTVCLHYRRVPSGAGLVLTWVVALGALHWLAAAMFALPWFSPIDGGATQIGLLQSLYAIVGFGIGVLFIAPLLRFSTLDLQNHDGLIGGLSATSAALSYLILGSLAYFSVGGLVRDVPTLNSVIATGLDIVVAGLCLGASAAIRSHRRYPLAGWIALSSAFPIATVVTAGFLGFGAFAVLSFFCFVGVFFRPRLPVLLVGAVVAYVALSVFVTYMRDRGSIRDSVWGGDSLSDRLDQVGQSANTFEWFDPANPSHLALIDGRLNQDRLVGAGVLYIEGGNRDFARGQTILGALVAVIPRAVWPDKPLVAGGSTLVTDYTGLDFAFGTTVGVGFVLELFINFGTTGVIVGSLVIGALLGALDRGARSALDEGNVASFTLQYVPALALVDVGNSLGVLTSRAAAAIVMVFLINRIVLPIIWKEQKRKHGRTLWRNRWELPTEVTPTAADQG